MVHTGRVKHATNPVDGVRVAYETVGDGEPFVLIHGTALSHAIWRGFGYVRALRDRYRLVLVDLRGHGRSDKPHDPASYAMDLMSADIVAVLDEVGLPSAHVLGYSLGGRVALALAVQYPEHLESLIIGGGSSLPQAGAFDRLFFPGCIDVLEQDGMDAFLERWNARRSWPIDAGTRAAFKANDAKALAAYMRRSGDEPGVDDEVLRRITVPTLLFVGSKDAERLGDTRRAASLIPGASSVILPGFDHSSAVAASTEVLAAVEPFLASV
ncbi:alpha/beta fold hydrolase [Rhodococcus sp. MSC1_016]|uniref:alpha/beta fold hydrolase n=1 Tax=Rhodococcus sp. MSC1_016 TaxID=2909266 RepID=UPI00202F93F7|nr:alpha/beta fold hydrolase [Rhodococcus sp. MSC1_016]